VGNGAALTVSEPWRAFLRHAHARRCVTVLEGTSGAHTHTHTHTHTISHTHIHIHTHIYTHMYTHKHTQAHTNVAV